MLTTRSFYFFYETDNVTQDKDRDHLSCRVCFEEYKDNEDLRVLPCFHRFHKDCIDAWLEKKKLCPLCNTSVDIVLKENGNFITS